MKKLLITGASGFLGWNICRLARDTWHLFGTVYSHQVDIPNVNTIKKIDLTNQSELKGLFEEVRPDAVIHTAAASDPNFCQVNQDASYSINVETSVNLALLCSDYMIPYVYTSTDLVFDGLKAPYRESDPVCPVNVYGEHKAQAEERILKAYPQSTVCRMSLMFGLSGPVAKSFIQPMLLAMKEGRELTLFVDEFRTPLSAGAAVSGLFLALNKLQGIIHLGGKERISRYDFGKLMQRIFKFEIAKIRPCKQEEIHMAAIRPADVSLDSSKAAALGFRPLPLIEELQNIYESL
ncbi:MAG: NAD(P)-dependent oxidoreductase [Deltaproteobacteria bacterium]|nr:MAG: NAD(P)-dependent oxidoreductase [Deltaproteobacteria bacterium]